MTISDSTAMLHCSLSYIILRKNCCCLKVVYKRSDLNLEGFEGHIFNTMHLLGHIKTFTSSALKTNKLCVRGHSYVG